MVEAEVVEVEAEAVEVEVVEVEAEEEQPPHLNQQPFPTEMANSKGKNPRSLPENVQKPMSSCMNSNYINSSIQTPH